ncbi:hypothetical protein OHS33_37810 (plasmid) [Streptomyces sp. NBC_00536]|uniref:hypothetical protein n=1 Tax=Streptomyces sp. NBC_00536 TaxID=2975769 RepID=UPI002E813800|nr:hypothetical protein [Streptomyces sp. NBC_00536]WUC84160.1 hypothetical protein OHS33_37810 [Streptomyces sp. NBC_00536]
MTRSTLSRSTLTHLSALLADAFHQDGLTRWMVQDEQERAERLPGFFRAFVELCADHGGVLTTPDGDAVLLFLPPGAEPDGARLAQAAAALGPHAPALHTIAALQEERHPHGPPHYYVAFAAVRADRQRDGLVSGLVARVMARADAEGVGMYTEASSPGGEAASRRAGFERVGPEIVLPEGGPVLRPMWRDAR